MRLNRVEESEARAHEGGKQQEEKLAQSAIFEARTEIGKVTVSDAVEKYMVALVFATRTPAKLDEELGKWIQVGVSPRGIIGLDRVSRAHAWMKGRDYVVPDDVKAIANDVFRHRLMLSYEAHAAGVTADQAIDRILERVAVA